MSLNRLANTTFPAIQLHRALDLERGRVCRISGNANKHEPLLVRAAAVVDDLGADEGWMSIEHFLRGRRGVGSGPVEDGGLCHYSYGAVRYPLPKGDVLSIRMGLDFSLGLDVEYLQCPTGWTRNAISSRSRSHGRSKRERGIHTFESQNLLVGVHNRGVCGNWSPQNIVCIVQVDNDDLVLLVDLLPHADEMVGFEGQCLSSVIVSNGREVENVV